MIDMEVLVPFLTCHLWAVGLDALRKQDEQAMEIQPVSSILQMVFKITTVGLAKKAWQVKVLVTLDWSPVLKPQNPGKGGKRELTPPISPVISTCALCALWHTYVREYTQHTYTHTQTHTHTYIH